MTYRLELLCDNGTKLTVSNPQWSAEQAREESTRFIAANRRLNDPTLLGMRFTSARLYKGAVFYARLPIPGRG